MKKIIFLVSLILVASPVFAGESIFDGQDSALNVIAEPKTVVDYDDKVSKEKKLPKVDKVQETKVDKTASENVQKTVDISNSDNIEKVFASPKEQKQYEKQMLKMKKKEAKFKARQEKLQKKLAKQKEDFERKSQQLENKKNELALNSAEIKPVSSKPVVIEKTPEISAVMAESTKKEVSETVEKIDKKADKVVDKNAENGIALHSATKDVSENEKTLVNVEKKEAIQEKALEEIDEDGYVPFVYDKSKTQVLNLIKKTS